MFTKKATVQVKDSKGTVVAKQDYNKVVFEGTEEVNGKVQGGTAEQLLGDAITFYQNKVGEKGNGLLALLADATYAYDLGERAKIRQTLVTAIAGPDKAIEKAIKDLMAARAAAGKPITEEAARLKIEALMAD